MALSNPYKLRPTLDVEAIAPTVDVIGGPSYLKRLIYAVLGSEFIPARLRTRLMRGLGFDVSLSATIWSNCTFRSNRVKIGVATFINVGFFYDGSDRLEIGDNVRVGQFVKIITSTHMIGPPEQRCVFEALTSPVHIEDGCWIGANCIVLPGVTIRKGCVIGANSLVSRSTDPNGLYAGSPARRIKELST